MGWHGGSSARGSRGPHDQLLDLHQTLRAMPMRSGARVNIMPKVIYEALEYPALSPTTMLVQLADSTIRYPEGIAEHIFVQVRDSFVLADFVVMDM